MARKFSRRDLALTAAVVFAFLWLAFIWPTPWREYKQGSRNLRVNRFTGAAGYLTDSGWQSGSGEPGDLRISDLLSSPIAWVGAGAVVGATGLLVWLLGARGRKALTTVVPENEQPPKEGAKRSWKPHLRRAAIAIAPFLAGTAIALVFLALALIGAALSSAWFFGAGILGFVAFFGVLSRRSGAN